MSLTFYFRQNQKAYMTYMFKNKSLYILNFLKKLNGKKKSLMVKKTDLLKKLQLVLYFSHQFSCNYKHYGFKLQQKRRPQ